MLFGLCTLANEHGLLPAELGREAEQRGFESLWFADHSHIPASRQTPWPGGPQLPAYYQETLDPLVCMAAAASATTRLRLGTGVALVVERDPIHFAKSVASLDVVSAGRIELGVGAGWNLEEMRNHGTEPSSRWQLMRERVEAMKAIWTTEPAEYHGRFVNFDPIFSKPKPRQQPHPKIHVGGWGPKACLRALRYGDGWIPILGRGDDDMVKHMAALPRAAASVGRELAGFEVTVFQNPGPPAQPGLLARYRAAGVHRVLFSVAPDNRDAALATLDRAVDVVRELG